MGKIFAVTGEVAFSLGIIICHSLPVGGGVFYGAIYYVNLCVTWCGLPPGTPKNNIATWSCSAVGWGNDLNGLWFMMIVGLAINYVLAKLALLKGV